jgi:RHS repeat-associated protein
VAKKVDGQVVEKYLWANLTTLLAVYDGDDNLKQRFEYASNRMPISMTQNGNKYYLHYDQVGTLKAVSDGSLNVIKEISYDTYGNILSETNPSFRVPFGFAGGLYDSDTKLTRFGYRDYDAYSGKWTAKDPIDFGGGDSNLYGYVLQDPVSGIDPSGLVDMNLVPKEDESLYENANNLNYSNIFTVAIHGNGGIIFSPEGILSEDIAEVAKKSGKSEILLIACYQGEGEFANSAQEIANLSGLPVQYTRGSAGILFGIPYTFPSIRGWGWHYAYPKRK